MSQSDSQQPQQSQAEPTDVIETAAHQPHPEEIDAPEDVHDDAMGTYLAEILEHTAADTSGAVADYIPQLRAVDPGLHALAVTTADGVSHSAGDDGHQFTIQSISKAFVYAMAVDDLGLDQVITAVGMEPSGEAFNEMSLEGGTGRPLNPMINAGAIAVHPLLDGSEHDPMAGGREHHTRTEAVRRRTARIVEGLSCFAGRELTVDFASADSEYDSAHRNLAIAHMLRTHEIITGEPAEAVRGYLDQCSVLVTVKDIALMAATLANNGVNPVTLERACSQEAARLTLSVMATCGMYDASGRWLARIGIPAKSGVSGGIIGVLPGQVGIASFAPRLDGAGNSVQGVEMFEKLSSEMRMHLMSNEPRFGAVEEADPEED